MNNTLLKIIPSILIAAVISNAQNITNTLGTSGTFKVKDGSTEYLSLDQSTGNTTFYRNLELGGVTNSTSSVGVITKNGQRFIHNFVAPGSFYTNTFIGINSGNFTLSSNSFHNTAVGYLTLNQLTDGHQNCAFGFLSMNKNASGNFNSAYGVSSLELNATGSANSAFGNFALRFNTDGNYNSAFGESSLLNNQSGFSNSAFGYQALYSNTTGNNNSAFGNTSLRQNSASDNSAFGFQSLFSNTSGGGNSAFGSGALKLNTIGAGNSSFGTNSLSSNVSGSSNSSFGVNSLLNNSTGSMNSAFGAGSMFYNTTGYYNSAFGDLSLTNNTTGKQNTAIGHKSLYLNVSGFQNTAVGDSALYKNTGNYNTAIGYNAGSNVTTGANLTLIGIDANPSSPTAIDQITLGNQFVQSLRCNVQTITSLSDARDKKNIKDLSLGLDFITKLKPRQFNWDRREWYENGVSDGSKMQETPTAGFIAQEFDEVQKSENAEWLNLVLKDNPDKWEATYGNLLPVMVKAIQELSIKNEKLKIEKDEEVAALKIKNANLEERLAKYEEFQTILVKRLEQLELNEQTFKVQIVNSENSNQ